MSIYIAQLSVAAISVGDSGDERRRRQCRAP